ncbi:kinase-interacting protein 1-like [Cornus florida]|uniref:kinase-interacting protein 1-like n=1 Tax=Cornus florida TaxID=4283 RepID=UPI0028A2CC3F|nr:kinase-interacting protein 1-like [Cornus florida]
MLQRAASNAYSWWWSSHVRTKQSKWLDQTLQDMEEKVQNVLGLIEGDGDTFAQRAEMYYKKRPELINYVEESYRIFRALAERYDHLSTELQNANTTIASVFPEKVQLSMDDEYECGSLGIPDNISQVSTNNIPKVPKFPNRDLQMSTPNKKSPKRAKFNLVAKSGLSESEALEEIDKLQKETLALQTEMEFVKSSYETALAKYWEIEKQVSDKHERVFSLQDEFGVGKVIEDDEARNLMAEAALKSCQETLSQLEEKQDRSTKEAREENEKIEDAREKLKSFKQKFSHDQTDEENPCDKDESPKVVEEQSQPMNQEAHGVTKERRELELLRDKIKEHFEAGSKRAAQEREELELLQNKIKEHFEAGSKVSVTVTELAEKIDELVHKIISLETAILSQTALINRLRTDTNDLQAHIRSLEDDKTTQIDGSDNLSNRLRDIEAKLDKLQDLNQNIENRNNNLQSHFTEARCSLEQLTNKLHSAKPDEDLEITESSQGERSEITDLLQEEGWSLSEIKSQQDSEKQSMPSPSDGFVNTRDSRTAGAQNNYEQIQGEEEEKVLRSWANDAARWKIPESPDQVGKYDLSPTPYTLPDTNLQEIATANENGMNWLHMLLDGLEDKEKILLREYTIILKNYKVVKKKLSEAEKKNRDSRFEMTVQLRELRSAVAKRDKENQSLRQKLKHLLASSDGSKDLEYNDLPYSDMLNDQSTKPEATTGAHDISESLLIEKEEEDIKLIMPDETQNVSPIEEKLQMNIDAILDENLDFWLRFSTSFQQMQKFKTGFQDLLDELSKLKEKVKTKQGGSMTTDQKSDFRAIYRHLREMHGEMTVWLGQSALLKDEQLRRFTALCYIQEDITKALKACVEQEEMKFTSHQAAKFQGKVLQMKQENNKVRGELQGGLHHVTALQHEIDKTLMKLNEEFGVSGSMHRRQSQLKNSTSRSRIPLQALIFGTKAKKPKNSLFSCMSPAVHRKDHDTRS